MLCNLSNKKGLLMLGMLSILIFIFNVNLAFAELNYTTGNSIYGVLADSSNINVTGALNLTLQITTCSLANCSDANWSAIYTNNSYNSLASLNNATYFQYKATFFTENQNYTPWLFNATIDYTYLDTTRPLLEFVSPTPLNNSGASGSFVINVSIIEEGLANVTLNWNGTLTAFNLSNESLHNLGSGNWAFTYTQLGLAVGQSYTYNVSVLDYAGNTNTTELRTIKGNTVPSFVSVLYTPDSIDNLDPGVNVTITANISDTDNNFDTAILQWKNSSINSYWNNVTMNNQTIKSFYTLLNASFTLPSYESNITFRIWANDTTSDSATTSNYTIQNFWDCTWQATSDLDATAGWDINKWIGNITINNTGDVQFATSNCTLQLKLTHNLAADTLSNARVYFDNNWWKPSEAYTISAKANRTIEINATFLTEVKQEDLVITTNEISSRSSTLSRNTTATLITNQNTPYLYQKITSSLTFVYLSSGNSFELQAYLRNLMGSATPNENYTAYNVSFNWTVPPELTNASGNMSVFYDNVTDNNLNYNGINLTFSNLATATSGVKTITLFAQGYNLTGSLIQDADGNTNLTEIISISFLCYNVSDSICVTSCGYVQDPDCSAPSTTPASSTSSGGGGGGSGGLSSSVAVVTSADYQLVRGKQNKVEIIFENKDKNESLRDLSFSVSGKISKYIEISPKTLSDLGPEQKATIILTIISPTYIELGKQELTILLSGKKGSSSYTDSKKIVLEIHELSIEEANQMLNESKELIRQLNEANLSSDYLNELLNKSETELNNFNLEVVKSNYNIIKEQVGYALDSKKIITELESLIKSAEEKGIDVSESARLLELAKLSIERKEFEQAYKRVKDSQLTYALEVKGEFGKLSYYLKEYPKEISFGAFFLIIFSFGAYNINKLRRIKKRIKELKEEEKILNELIKVVQNQCFKEKKMSMSEYETAMKEYDLKLSEVVEELIELETKRTQMLRFASKTKRFELEKEKIISLIEELQEDYMKKKKLETRTYEFKMDSFNKRLSEIEEKLATLEAKKAVNGLGISLKIPKGE